VKITDIKRQAKKEHRVSVFIDEEFSFGLSESQLLEEKLAIGDEVDAEKLKELKQLSKLGKLKELAVAWAMRRNHSKREIINYLRKKTDDESEQKETLNFLESLGFVDDERFSEVWVSARHNKGMSSFVIKGELIKKGVVSEIIDSVMANIKDIDALRTLVDKKKNRSAYKDEHKFMAYLASKGYNYDDIKKVLKEI